MLPIGIRVAVVYTVLQIDGSLRTFEGRGVIVAYSESRTLYIVKLDKLHREASEDPPSLVMHEVYVMPEFCRHLRTLTVTIVELCASDEETQAALKSDSADSYSIEMEDNLPVEILQLIAYGLLFREGWTACDTQSEWKFE